MSNPPGIPEPTASGLYAQDPTIVAINVKMHIGILQAQLIFLQEMGAMTVEIVDSMAALIATYNYRPSPSASTSNEPMPSPPQIPRHPPIMNMPNVGRSGGPMRGGRHGTIRGERDGTTQQNAVPTGGTIPNRLDTGNISGNIPLNFSLPHITTGVSPANPELTIAISGNVGPNTSELIIRPGDSIIVYLRNSTGRAIGFNSTIKLGGEFPANFVRRVEPQPNLEPKVAIAVRSRKNDSHHTSYRATSTRRIPDRWASSPENSDLEISYRGPDSATPRLEYNAQDCIIVCSQKVASYYGLNVSTGLMGWFDIGDVRIVKPRDQHNLDRRKAKRTAWEPL